MMADIARSDGAEPSPPANALENRIRGILEQMTAQDQHDRAALLQDRCNERLGIPQFRGSDDPHGIGNGAEGWSCFPVPLAMRATWEPGLIKEVGKAINLEQPSRGRHRIAGPVLDLLHDPRNGRAPETIGEDPFLGGRIMEAFLHGQNDTTVFGATKRQSEHLRIG